MELGKIVGNVVATRKNERLKGYKLLVAEYITPNCELKGAHVVGVDLVDAGVGDIVLIVRGSSARTAEGMTDKPVDGSIVAVVDTIEYKGNITYKKRNTKK
ncbi:EutN/CcmL family microcompartment protein [bacterium]|nr:EutN/CcmL family microcompartment protein [bacterium]